MAFPEPGQPHSKASNVGAYLDAVTSLYPRSFTAGSGSDNAFLDGEDVDRVAKHLPSSALIVTQLRLVMASGATAIVTTNVQDKDVDESYADYGTQPDPVTITANDDGSAIVTQIKVAVDLNGAKQYVAHRTKVNMSASGTDTCAVSAAMVLGGLDTLPAD